MNRDEMKGKAKDIKGRVQRQVGEWTGDSEQQLKGAGSQLEGKVQGGIGKMKEAGNRVMHDVKSGVRQDQPSALRHEKDVRHEDDLRNEEPGRKVA